MTTRHGIVCFSINEWADVPRNQIQLMRVAAARGYRVLYVETVGLRKPELTRRDLRKFVRRFKKLLRPLRHRRHLWVLSPFALPIHGNRRVDALNKVLLNTQVSLACRILGLRRPILWSYLPQGVLLRQGLRPSRTVYFRCDDYTSFRGVHAEGIKRLEHDAVANADLCIASAREYLEGPLRHATAKLWSPNAVDLAHYVTRGSDPYEGRQRPVLFMMGTLEYWLATELLAEVAQKRRNWTIALAGPVRTDLSVLTAEPNVEYLGVLSYNDLPCYVGWADVCLIPFRVLPVTRGANPGKLFQYLAAGRPVVTTRFLDPEPYGRNVYFADENPNDFVAAVERALREDGPEQIARRRSAMVSETWTARFAEIEEALQL